MSAFSDNINARRLQLGYTYQDVHDKMAAMTFSQPIEPPSYSAVGNWFNGQRRPRHMEHLIALCEVLQMSVEDAARGELAPLTDVEATLLSESRGLPDAQVQALIDGAASVALFFAQNSS